MFTENIKTKASYNTSIYLSSLQSSPCMTAQILLLFFQSPNPSMLFCHFCFYFVHYLLPTWCKIEKLSILVSPSLSHTKRREASLYYFSSRVCIFLFPNVFLKRNFLMANFWVITFPTLLYLKGEISWEQFLFKITLSLLSLLYLKPYRMQNC